MLNTQNQKMPCPVAGCEGEISFNTYKLLEGAKFVCPNCKGEIGLAPGSRDKVENTLTKFEKMREKLLREKEKHTNN